MLVNKKLDYELFQEQTVLPAKLTKPKPDFSLRAKCLKIVILASILTMFVAIQSEIIVRSGYGLVQMKNQVAQLEKDNETLRLDIAKLKSPQRIQHIATSQLGMVAPLGVYCASGAPQSGGNPDRAVANNMGSIFSTNKAEASGRL